MQVNPNGSTSAMAEKNPVLPKGVIGIAFGATPADTVIKVGDGILPWNSLPKYGDTNPVVTDITALTTEQLDALKPGHVVVKKTGNAQHAYFVAYKDDVLGEISLVYTDRWTIEEVYYEKHDGAWAHVVTDVYSVPVPQAESAPASGEDAPGNDAPQVEDNPGQE